ncbi:MAG: GDP-mannose 4,6-dehydratase [Opitutales bacterium]|nr:GDP-mannose 4,6-dehydratase [Opitutales bacterium]
MNILITGGAGFIGSNFIDYFINKYPEHSLTNLDALTYAGNPDNLKAFSHLKNYTFVRGNICDPEFVSRQLQGIDMVVHFAAESHVDRSFNASLKFTIANTYGTHVLLECVKKSSISKFIHISTDEVYGEVLQGSSVESDPLAPTNPYSASKAAAEMILFGYMHAYHLPVVIARPNNNYGPFQFPEKLIPRFITNSIEGRPLPLQNPHPRRTYIHVKDTARAVDCLIHQGVPGEIYNIGTHDEFSNVEIAMMILTYIS